MNSSNRTCAKQEKGAHVIPFTGLRYDPDAVGDLAQVVSPPYDIISPARQQEYHNRHPHNAIHLDFALEKPGDDDSSNRYTRAAAALDQWLSDGVLKPDPEPAIYYLKEEFTGPDGEPAAREGFIAAVKLAEFSEGVVLPHEETSSGPKQDRLLLMRATEANLSAIFCLYSDPEHNIKTALDSASTPEPDLNVTDDDGTRHSLWVITDPEATSQVTAQLACGNLLIADGHHRYETALAYRDERRQGQSASGREQPYDYMMVYLSNMEDSSPSILPIHRLVSGLKPETLKEMASLLSEDFKVTAIEGSSNDERAKKMMEALAAATDRNAFGLFMPDAGEYYLLEARRPRPVLSEEQTGHSAAWRSLEVSVLDRLVLAELLDIRPGGSNENTKVRFVERTGNALKQAQEGNCDAAFFLNATTMAEIKAVAEAGEKMPQKSTYFHPKPLTGLVFRSLK